MQNMAINLFIVGSRCLVPRTSNITIIQSYSRWAHRRPAKVMLPFEESPSLKKEKIIDLSDTEELKQPKKKIASKEIKINVKDISENNVPVKQVITSEKSASLKEKRDTLLKKRMFYHSQKKVFDDNGEIIYEKLKENDGKLMPLLVNLKSKKDRTRSGMILVEGHRLIIDGLEAKCRLKYVVFSQVEDLNKLKPFLPKSGVVFYKIPYKEIELLSNLETSPGLFGIFATPTVENIKRLSKPLPLQFICDNVRDPGNLGAILRAAVGVGCDKVFLTKGCVDLWDPKVVRSAAGAHFRQPIHYSVDWEELDNLIPPETSIFIADNNTDSLEDDSELSKCHVPVVPYYGVDFSNLEHVTLVIGGETEGINENSYKLAESRNGTRLNIPLQKGVDSLNTGMAAAVIAFEIKKQFIQAWKKVSLEKKELQAN